MHTHYERASGYWEYQSGGGEAGGVLNREYFQPHIRPTDTVLDFGCGGGNLLHGLTAGEKIGVEIGPEAADHARQFGLTVYPVTSKVRDGTVDVAISSHALEHTLRPVDELAELHRALRDGGRLVLLLPIDDWRNGKTVDTGDVNHHLYTWSPLLLGNLLQEACFQVESCRVLTHAWRPDFLAVKQRSELGYRAARRLLSMLRRRRQIQAIATKGPAS